jgi:DNA repair protein RadD
MAFKFRDYQVEAISAGVDFFTDKKKKYNGLEILPTGSGKSVVIAGIAKELPGKSVILQPSKEILEQNFQKFISYGFRAGIYSASAGLRYVDDVTFATIGSIVKKPHLFASFKNIIVDECHLVNPEEGMYHSFIKTLHGAKVLGLTATPYRLASNSEGSELRFLTRQTPRMFNKVLYYVQNDVLFNAGHLAPLKYFPIKVIDRTRLTLNSAGSDYTDNSIRAYYREIDMAGKTIHYAQRILKQRRNLLIFCGSLEEAYKVGRALNAPVIDGDTDKEIRKNVLRDFKAGKIRCVVNVKVLDTGFDYPALEAVLISKSTMSLAVYYQIVGRVMRPYIYDDGSVKEGWVVDLGGNIDLFSKIETMRITKDERGLYMITNNGRQLTNVPFNRSIAA